MNIAEIFLNVQPKLIQDYYNPILKDINDIITEFIMDASLCGFTDADNVSDTLRELVKFKKNT